MKNILYKAPYAVFLILIIAETNYLNNKEIFLEKLTLSSIIFGSLGLFLFVTSLPGNFNNKYLRIALTTLKAILSILLLLLIISEVSIASFSGITFGVEVFYHFEWKAVVLGVREYRIELSIFLPLMLIIVFTLTKNVIFTTVKQQCFWFSIAIILLIFFIKSTVVGRLYLGLSEYYNFHAVPVSVSQLADVNVFNHLGIQASAITKNEIKTHFGNNKNIIIVYLESFSHFFTSSKKFPGLTPNINRLKKQHGELINYYSSAGFTMDALISSNCGFIPNTVMGNNTLLGAERPYFNLPCATDVLAKAGYYQEFIGGAHKSFANKGRFLLDHGFDRVWGWEDFDKEEKFQLEGAKNWWGLHDEDLFDFATKRIIDLQGKGAFHLSVLTISTHLKGFVSPSCEKYSEIDDRYINAVHCLDKLLGDFVQNLQKRNLLENSILILTADHGVLNSDIIRNLFGNNLNRDRILGIIIDGENKSIEEPTALYDLGPALLNMLGIEHNVKFIFGKDFQHANKERLLFSKRHVFQEGVWRALKRVECRADHNVLPVLPIDFCELAHILKTVHGFTGSFGLLSGVNYDSGSILKITFNEDTKKILDILFNGGSLVRKFRRKAFILQPVYLTREGVFMMFFNLKESNIFNMFNFGTGEKDLSTISATIKAYDNAPFIIFSNRLDANLNFIKTIQSKHNMLCVTDYFCMKDFDLLGEVSNDKSQQQIVLSFFGENRKNKESK
ncbi:MAG: LTA synthase family protein [Xanthomonadales bacterium]|nr:LTA synthase family protein [Xanthomonadales bacterium]